MEFEEKIYTKEIGGHSHRIHRHGTNLLQVEGAKGAIKFHPHEETTVPYLMTINDNFIVTSGLNDKMIKFWKITEILEGHTKNAYYQYKSSKKLTALKWIEFKLDGEDVKGIIYSNRFGEVRFFNHNDLPEIREDKQGSNNIKESEERKVNERAADEEIENNAKLLFGHQDTISHLVMTEDNNYVITSDCNKIKVTHFPEVTCVHSVTFHGCSKIDELLIMHGYKFVTYSNTDRCFILWDIKDDHIAVHTQLKGPDFVEKIGEEIHQGDRIKINKVEEDGTITITLDKANSTKAVIFKVEL